MRENRGTVCRAKQNGYLNAPKVHFCSNGIFKKYVLFEAIIKSRDWFFLKLFSLKIVCVHLNMHLRDNFQHLKYYSHFCHIQNVNN